MTPASQRIFRQHAKKLMATKAYLIARDDECFGLFREGQKSQTPHAKIKADYVTDWLKADLLEGSSRLSLSPQGRAYLNRFLNGGDFLAQHKLITPSKHNDAARQTQTTPLQWLQSRRPAHRLGISDVQFEAGHQLSRDYDRAALPPRQTMDWQRPIFVDGGRSQSDNDISEVMLDARRRFEDALLYVGPGLSDVAVAICCAEVGLEECERGFELPKRSAKLLLKMALMRLSVHYGLQSARDAAASFRMR